MNDPLVRKTISPFLLVSTVFFLINYFVYFSGVLEDFSMDSWYWSYVFLVPVSALGMAYIAKRYSKSKKITSIGKNYILYTVVKMILSILFLLPWLLHKDESSKPMVIQFFIIFFPFLLVETILLVRLLNTPLDEKMKNEENQS